MFMDGMNCSIPLRSAAETCPFSEAARCLRSPVDHRDAWTVRVAPLSPHLSIDGSGGERERGVFPLGRGVG